MKKRRGDKPYVMISAVSRMLSMHPQTIRNYEKMGLIRPERTNGGMRRFSENDLERLELVKEMKELGVNPAGVEMLMRLRDNMDRMRMEMEKEMEALRQEMEKMRRRLGEV